MKRKNQLSLLVDVKREQHISRFGDWGYDTE